MMRASFDRILAEAMELPSHDRAELAARLIATLDRRGERANVVARVWEQEIRRRIAEIDAGTGEMAEVAGACAEALPERR